MAAKVFAQEQNSGSNQAYTTQIGGMEFQIKPHGGAGVTFILSNNLFTVSIRPAKVDFNISVTYRSRTLWEYGAAEARRMIWEVLLREMNPRPREGQNEEAAIVGWRKLSRVDYAFDFHSPEFTGEIGPTMIDRVVCHSSCKVRWDFKADEHESYIMGTSNRVQTLTIGKKGALQVQVYNKTDEITEKSQKTWMYKLWENSGLEPLEGGKYSDVWRIELRFGRDYLAERGIDEFEDFEAKRDLLLSEALKTRRLTDRTDDTNRRRWPVHPMWCQAIDMAGNSPDMVSLDGHKEFAPKAIIEKIEQDIAAALRRFSVLETGGDEYDWLSCHNLMVKVINSIEEDENHEKKMKEYGEKYKYINEPL